MFFSIFFVAVGNKKSMISQGVERSEETSAFEMVLSLTEEKLKIYKRDEQARPLPKHGRFFLRLKSNKISKNGTSRAPSPTKTRLVSSSAAA